MKTYKFECNMSNEYKKYTNFDEWGSATLWLNDKQGVEYNFCIDNSTNEIINSSAIYKMELNEETDYIETDYSIFEHYEIDFNIENWREELEKAMYEVAKRFFK